MRLRPPSPPSRPRQVANVVAAVFLLGALAVVVITAQQIFNPNYDDYDTQVLTRDLTAFAGPVGDPEMLIDVQPCTGEGSVPAAAQRRYVVSKPIATVESDVVAEATSLGWVGTPPPAGLPPQPGRFAFEQGDRDLMISLSQIVNGGVEVTLGVTGGNAC